MTHDPAPRSASRQDPGLAELLGGRAGAVDASVPVVAFVLAWLVAGWSGSAFPINWGAGAAVVAGAGTALWRLRQGRKPRAVLFGLAGVVLAAGIALATGRASDFFLVQIVSNAGSALAWAISTVVRWPLLGVIVGGLLGQRTRWRRDPDLLRGYQRASWAWVFQYVVRLAVFLPLWAADQVLLLGLARTIVSPVLVGLSVLVSWPLLRTALPRDHPGIRHPRVTDADPGSR
ncbi:MULTISPECIES: DUF3159 domain-containing protein [unclassified Pseudonocardia]|uniref:DUF3159 domain-containing protein n=1 Tax=unclassified Pseudonocardia TaxID=2619320 RepID=UPI0001FFE0EA|nr:DUF3159 domain-containing protein [Pseudonocardia sp. Ae707_Ps1]OLM21085.1 putative CONSERVED INTEGRAL MEMBRANE ALANINE AND LEUCINE RICH PROTEIN [Pseudonocardia sp. Ae707_Ps1]